MAAVAANFAAAAVGAADTAAADCKTLSAKESSHESLLA